VNELHLRLRAYVSSIQPCIRFAAVSSLLIGTDKLSVGRKYGYPLLLSASSLCAAAFATIMGVAEAAASFAAFSCGIQNAVATNYSGGVIRTTHVTGTVTDIGVLCVSASWRYLLEILM
jgi:uncharacterized membrane protein YoaK (UPF0700 family)